MLMTGTFSTGDEPLFLGQSPAWWDIRENRHRTETEWEAFERHMGLTREMVEIIAKVGTTKGTDDINVTDVTDDTH